VTCLAPPRNSRFCLGGRSNALGKGIPDAESKQHSANQDSTNFGQFIGGSAATRTPRSSPAKDQPFQLERRKADSSLS